MCDPACESGATSCRSDPVILFAPSQHARRLGALQAIQLVLIQEWMLQSTINQEALLQGTDDVPHIHRVLGK